MRRLAALAVLIVASAIGQAADKPAPAAPAAAEAPSAKRQKELRAEQKELKARLAQLKKNLASKESAHSEAADALAASETAISVANRQLQELATARHQVERRIVELHASQREAAAAQSGHASRLALALREEYLDLQDGDLAAVADPEGWLRDRRDSAYLDYLVRARLRHIGELHDRRQELDALEAELQQRSAELARIDGQERAGRAQLLHQEAARRATLARLAREIATQRQSVAGLERDDARLTSVIDQIGKLLAEQARRRATPRARGSHEPAPAAPEPGHAGAHGFEPPAGSHFAQQRGRLVLPVQGAVASRFGEARLAEDGQPQVGAPAWKGLFIRADAGAPVHAVAPGRVVFADWLRGFGNLMILDHGEGFLSVYAYNESLLHGVGDDVSANDVIASVGSSGGNAQSGLYFEMRFEGRPFDPLSWAVPR